MKTVTKEAKISREELSRMSEKMFGGLVKAVVDLEKKIMVVDAEMHADEEAMLLEAGSKQENLWGINFYPAQEESDFLEFDSMINIRPRQNNRSRTVESTDIQEKIRKLVQMLIQ